MYNPAIGMQTWEELRTGLIGIGFMELLYVELECARHGALRIGFQADSEFHPACPKCGVVCDAATLARGLSRKTAGEWTCVSPALPNHCKVLREDPIIILRSKQNTRRRRPEFLARAQRELKEVLPRLTTRIREPEPAPRPRSHRATPEEMRRRIVLLAELLLRRESPEVIERTLEIEWKFLKVTIFRRQEEIRSVMRTLQGADRTLSMVVMAKGAAVGGRR